MPIVVNSIETLQSIKAIKDSKIKTENIKEDLKKFKNAFAKFKKDADNDKIKYKDFKREPFFLCKYMHAAASKSFKRMMNIRKNYVSMEQSTCRPCIFADCHVVEELNLSLKAGSPKTKRHVKDTCWLVSMKINSDYKNYDGKGILSDDFTIEEEIKFVEEFIKHLENVYE